MLAAGNCNSSLPVSFGPAGPLGDAADSVLTGPKATSSLWQYSARTFWRSDSNVPLDPDQGVRSEGSAVAASWILGWRLSYSVSVQFPLGWVNVATFTLCLSYAIQSAFSLEESAADVRICWPYAAETLLPAALRTGTCSASSSWKFENSRLFCFVACSHNAYHFSL